jgi:phosphopantetheinyl transferase (holo-ACP synthase)
MRHSEPEMTPMPGQDDARLATAQENCRGRSRQVAPEPAVVRIMLATPDMLAGSRPPIARDRQCPTGRQSLVDRRSDDKAAARVLLDAAAGVADSSWSLSHSHGYAALALAPGGMRIGVDVELLRHREFLGMAQIAFTAGEIDYIRQLSEPLVRRFSFYELWTLKEAFAKALQLHLLDALRLCHFVNEQGAWTPCVPTEDEWQAAILAPRPDLRLAVAVVGQNGIPHAIGLRTLELDRECTGWPVVRVLSSSTCSAPFGR